MEQTNKAKPVRAIFSDHALERLEERFAISPFEVSYLLDTAQTSVDFRMNFEGGIINRVLWVGQHRPFMVVKQDIQSGVVITVWTDQIFEEVAGRKISRKILQQATQRFFFRTNSDQSQATPPAPLRRHERPMVNIEYRRQHANKPSKRLLGRVGKGVCELAWQGEKWGVIESLVRSKHFYQWLYLYCERKEKISIAQISSLSLYFDEENVSRFEAPDILTFCADNNALDIFSKSTNKEGIPKP